MAEPDFSRPFIVGYGSSPSQGDCKAIVRLKAIAKQSSADAIRRRERPG
jgi:hypothetical protein